MTGPAPEVEPLAFVVNGLDVRVSTPPDTPLLTVLRDELGLLGARFGCGLGQCGACFVNLDGHVVPSCDTPVSQASGGRVVTVEGLSSDGEPHPVQRALLDHQAAQCGFCTAGVVVRAAALLDEVPSPDEDAVRAALDRNLCRCGVQQRVVRAVVAAGAASRAEERP